MLSEERPRKDATPPPTIDQVRELLFGHEQRTMGAQLAALRADLENVHREFERQVADLRREFATLAEQADVANRERFAKVGQAIEQIGREVGALSER